MPAAETMTVDEARAALRRFQERFDRAVAQAPPTKAWVRDALRRRGAPRCPVRLKRLSYDAILRHGDALADLFSAHPDDVVFVQAYEAFVGFQPPGRPDAVDPVRALTQDAEWTDEWGTRWAHASGGVGASTVAYPLSDWSALDDYLSRMPDPAAPGRLDAVLPSLRGHGATKYFCGMAHLVLYERYHCLRSMEDAFADFLLQPREAERLLEALTDYSVGLVRAWAGLEGVDALFLTDDWGTQKALMISPDLWRKFFARRYRRIFDEAHRAGLDVVFHSCGNVTAIVGDLIDLGVDVIDPLQPEAMDLERIAREFGGKVAFSGGLSDQKIARSTPEEVKDEVRRTVDRLGRAFKNAYIVAPSNVLTPDIPLANIEAMFEASHAL